MIQIFTVNIPKIVQVLLTGTLAIGLVSCSEKEDESVDIDPTQRECEEDTINDPAASAALTLGTPVEQYICPIQDQDWYNITIPPSDQLLSVSLSMAIPVSPVDVTYALFPKQADGTPGPAAAQPPSKQVKIGAQLAFSHCLAPGDYYMIVRDQGDNGTDTRNAYTLNVSSKADPDPGEPNADVASATMLTTGQAHTGYIACRGDEDYYTITVPADNRISVSLTSAQGDYQPRIQIADAAGEVFRDASNLRGAQEATSIEFSQVLPGAGTYTIIVSDDDNENADADVPYTLQIDSITDIDPNEPNDTPETATPISTGVVACGGSWSQEFTFSGTIGSPGDDDWFRIPLSGCNPGIIEASVDFATSGRSAAEQWTFNSKVQATVTVVRPHVPSACGQDEDCTTLQLACSNSLECAGFGDLCIPGQELCAGAVACLPEGSCGANQMQRRYECPTSSDECKAGSGAPPANRAALAAPILGHDFIYVRVNDYQGNGDAPEDLYTLRVRVRNEPDANEPSNLPLGIIQPSYERGDLFQAAKPIPVHDCTAGDCCGTGNRITGTISYDSDSDYYQYAHPCPGSDCTLRMVWDTQAGPVDIGLNVYRPGGNSWIPAREPDQQDNHPADSGTLGGVGAGDECYYAYETHSTGYIVEVRDRTQVFSDEVNVRPDSRDWSADQTYSFCIEKVSNVCEEPPCQVYQDGCGPPQ